MRIEELRAVALLAAVLAPPAVAVFRHLGHGLRLTERFLIAWALAPVGLALPALALVLTVHLPLRWCVWQSVFLWAVAGLWPRSATAPAAPAEPLPERGQGFPSVAAGATALGAALLVGTVSLSVPLAQMWGEAWLHGAAVTELAIRGVPPQDPNFAGVPLYQGWFYHFIVSLLAIVSGLSVFAQMTMVNVWAVVVLVLAVAQLAYRAFGRAAAMWAGGIAVLGLDPFGWMLWIARGASGENAGLSGWFALLGTTDDAAAALSYQFPLAHVSLLDRFWSGAAITPGFALGCAVAWSAARALDRPSAGAWWRTLALAITMAVIHPGYAACALAGLALGLPLAGASGARRALGLALGLGLAFGAAIVYARASGVPGAAAGAGLGFNLGNLWSLVLAIGPWWIVAAPAARDAWRREGSGRFAAAAAAVMALIALVIVLPGGSSERLFDLAWVSSVPLVAGGVAWWGDRLRLPTVARLVVVTALVVPTSGLYILATANDPRSPGVLIRGDLPDTRRKPLTTADEGEAYLYMRENLPRDAVVIEKPRPTVNEPVPVLGERRVFCGALDVTRPGVFGKGAHGRVVQALREEFQIRRRIQHTLFQRGELEGEERLYIAGFSAPIFLMVRHSEVSDRIWDGFRGQIDWTEEFSNEEVRLYQFRGRALFSGWDPVRREPPRSGEAMVSGEAPVPPRRRATTVAVSRPADCGAVDSAASACSTVASSGGGGGSSASPSTWAIRSTGAKIMWERMSTGISSRSF